MKHVITDNGVEVLVDEYGNEIMMDSGMFFVHTNPLLATSDETSGFNTSVTDVQPAQEALDGAVVLSGQLSSVSPSEVATVIADAIDHYTPQEPPQVEPPECQPETFQFTENHEHVEVSIETQYFQWHKVWNYQFNHLSSEEQQELIDLTAEQAFYDLGGRTDEDNHRYGKYYIREVDEASDSRTFPTNEIETEVENIVVFEHTYTGNTCDDTVVFIGEAPLEQAPIPVQEVVV